MAAVLKEEFLEVPNKLEVIAKAECPWKNFEESKLWYNSLAPEQKKRLLQVALFRFPNLSYFMKMHGIRASSPEFTTHFTFKLFIEILQS